jgi:hypothetical protein
MSNSSTIHWAREEPDTVRVVDVRQMLVSIE